MNVQSDQTRHFSDVGSDTTASNEDCFSAEGGFQMERYKIGFYRSYHVVTTNQHPCDRYMSLNTMLGVIGKTGA